MFSLELPELPLGFLRVLGGGDAPWEDAEPGAGGLSRIKTQGKVPSSPCSSMEVSLQPPVLTQAQNNSLVVVLCLGNYLKPSQHELGNKAPVVFSVIPRKILLVFNR